MKSRGVPQHSLSPAHDPAIDVSRGRRVWELSDIMRRDARGKALATDVIEHVRYGIHPRPPAAGAGTARVNAAISYPATRPGADQRREG